MGNRFQGTSWQQHGKQNLLGNVVGASMISRNKALLRSYAQSQQGQRQVSGTVAGVAVVKEVWLRCCTWKQPEQKQFV